MSKTLHIIDGSGYIFRAYYAIRALATAGGEPTNAVYGFTTMIEKALREEKPEYLAITFDVGGPNFRRDLYRDYKATRSPPPEDLPRQIPRIHQITDAFRIKTFKLPGVEADDVIATLTRQARAEGFEVVIISGDKDLMQLVGDHVRMFEPMKVQRFGPKEVEEKWGVPPARLADVLALTGDTSDNIPGVSGVGQKTAVKLLLEHGDLEGVLAAAEAGRVKGKLGQTLKDSAEAARLSRRLVELKTDVELGAPLEALRYEGPDRARLRELFVELEFRRLIPQAEAAPGPEASEEESALPEAPRPALGIHIDRSRYRPVLTADELASLVAELRRQGRCGVALELTEPRTADAELVGLGFAWAGGGAYVPLRHRYLGCPAQRPEREVLAALAPILADPELSKLSAESKTLAGMAERLGLRLAGLGFDSTIASFLLEPDDLSHGPETVARRWLGHEPLVRAEVLAQDKGERPIEALEVERATALVAERADIALVAGTALTKPLEEAELSHVLSDVELPLVPVLARMELAGVRIDVERLVGMSARFAEELGRLEKACYAALGREFNIGSPKQLQKILFEELGLKIIKRTKTGPSTDHSVLEILANEHELPELILDYRQVQKLKSTYVDALPKMVSPRTGRVHTHLSQTSAATGRLASTDPNLQNIPIRTELGRELRKVFIADPGHVLVSVDYSQIELRVLAHFSKDPILTEAFLKNEDVHTRTAAALFQIPPAQVSREQRTQAKAVNFGVLYGMGPVRLARDLKIPRRTASQFVEDYFARQPGVKRYIDETLDFARKHGIVRTLLGRRRAVADINSQNRGARAAAERVAVNTPIQGSAADLIKMAMIRLDARIIDERVPARLLLQVHDELLLETPAQEAERVARLVREEMERVFPLEVPLIAEAHWGANWDDAH